MTLHPRLAQDCSCVGQFTLCQLLLMEDANYPWFILVPMREGISEIHQLASADQQQLMHESVVLSRAIEQAFHPDKLNIAALGNIVPQLHVHHIVRYAQDPCWPEPVWGRVVRRDYTDAGRRAVLEPLVRALSEVDEFSRAKKTVTGKSP